MRLACYLIGAATWAIFAPAWLAGMFLAVVLGAELVERAVTAPILCAVRAGSVAAIGPSRTRRFGAALIATEAAVAVTLGAIWYFAAPETKILPLSMFMIPLIAAVQAGHRVAGILLIRQAIYLGVLCAMALRDVVLAEEAGLRTVALELLPVLLLAAVTMAVTWSRGRAYLRRLNREAELAVARERTAAEIEAKSRFVATISHELRTSLNGVLGMAQTLLNSDLDPHQRRQAEVIAESGRSLNTLLNDILDHTKLEVGKLAIERRPEELRQSVEHITWLHGAVAGEKGLELSVEVAPDVPEQLMIDAVRVRQCLSNLVANAIKFTDEGSVDIRVSCVPSGIGEAGTPSYIVTAVVSDTGIGIAPDRARQLFLPFTQADGTISRRYGGTGLGLSITRQLAQSMGGTVWLESEPGKGSSFFFTFRADGVADAAGKGPAEAGAGTESTAPTGDELGARRVLIADYVATSRLVMRHFLNTLGVEVSEVGDGPAALAALERENFHAALLDINMPGLEGAEVAQRLRGGGGRAGLTLVAISADGAGARIDTGDDGFDAVLRKPVDPAELKRILAGAIRRRAAAAGRRAEEPLPPA